MVWTYVATLTDVFYPTTILFVRFPKFQEMYFYYDEVNDKCTHTIL